MFHGKYIDYVEIDEEFQPVFNEEVDKTNTNLWKSFIPHKNFIDFLEITIKAMERSRSSENKSLWIFGSYGTGKTHAVFVLKHLLEDSDREIEEYISKRELNKFISDKLKMLRKREKILVVFKSGASHINNSMKLLIEIQDAIYKGYIKYLNQKGINYIPTKTEVQLLRDRLNDELINWNVLLKKHKSKLKVSSLSNLKKKLEDEEVDSDFVVKLIDVLEEEGINVKFNIESFKEWIREIFNSGHISRLLFIWDEFSGFFKLGAPMDTFQEIAHITQELPFYLLIVTHRLPEHLSETVTEDISKLKDRFHYIHYSIEPITVYNLIYNVIYPKNKEKWRKESENIWLMLESNFSLEKESYKLLEFEKDATLEDIKKLIPIHPYSAFISSRIVEHFGSSQRTLFQFLKADESTSFRAFLKNYPDTDYYLLTPDFLWDYFFANNREISEFHPEVVRFLNYWGSWKEKLDEEEQKILKFVLLLNVLGLKIQLHEKKLLKSCYTTIKIAFSGTPSYKKIDPILDSLIGKKVLKELETADDKEYFIPIDEIDREELENAKKLYSFCKVIKDNEEKISKEIKVYHRDRRIILKPVCAEEILDNRIPELKLEPYQIGIVLVVTKEIEKMTKLRKKINELMLKHPNTFFILSYAEFHGWKALIENLAYRDIYKRLNKEREAKIYEREADKILESWLNDLKNSRFDIVGKIEIEHERISSEIIQQENCIGINELKNVVADLIVRKLFPYGLDDIITKNPLWRWENNKVGLQVGLLHFREKAKKGMWRDLYSHFVEKDGIIDENGDFTFKCDLRREHPICRMRETVNTLFEKNEEVSLFDVWRTLSSPPFGLYKSPLASFILGIIMKEYSEGYFATDGLTEEEVSPQGMVNYLYETIKEEKEWKLRQLSKQQKAFCKLVREIFKLSEGETNTPKNAIINVRNKIKSTYKYPLWVLKYAIEKEKVIPSENGSWYTDYTEIELDIVDTLDTIIKSAIDERNKDELIKDLMNAIDDAFSQEEKKWIVEELQDFVNPEKFEAGFKEFVAKNFFIHLDRDFPEDFDKILEKKFKDRMQEEPWAWEKDKAEKVLNSMVVEIKISKSLSECLGTTSYFLDDLFKLIDNKIRKVEILPLWLYKYHYLVDNEIKNVINWMDNMLNTLREKDFSNFASDLIISIHELNFSENYRDVLNRIFLEKERSLQNWLLTRFDNNLSESELQELIEKLEVVLYENQQITETDLLDIAKNKLKELQISILKAETKELIEKAFGTIDVSEFYRNSFIPIVTVKYLPEFKKLDLPEDITLDEFLKDLTKIDFLSRNEIERLKEILNKNFEMLAILRESDISAKILKAFLGREWIEGIFKDEDLIDLKEYLSNKLSEKTENWSEMEIRNEFAKWKTSRYKQKFYSRLVEIVNNMSGSKAKNLITKIIEDPDIGLRVMELLEKRLK